VQWRIGIACMQDLTRACIHDECSVGCCLTSGSRKGYAKQANAQYYPPKGQWSKTTIHVDCLDFTASGPGFVPWCLMIALNVAQRTFPENTLNSKTFGVTFVQSNLDVALGFG